MENNIKKEKEGEGNTHTTTNTNSYILYRMYCQNCINYANHRKLLAPASKLIISRYTVYSSGVCVCAKQIKFWPADFSKQYGKAEKDTQLDYYLQNNGD